MEHLGLDKIFSYIENNIGKNEISDVEVHIATCEKCFNIYKTILMVEKALEGSFKGEKREDCPEEWELGSFIHGELTEEYSKEILPHIKECDSCFEKTANYYASYKIEEKSFQVPYSWKLKAVQAISAKNVSIHKKETSIFSAMNNFINHFKNYLRPVPAFAIAIIILILFLIPIFNKKKDISIIISSEKMTIRDSEIPSSFGFSGSGTTKEVKYMKALYDGKTIIMSWQKIEETSKYNFLLKEKESGKVIYTKSIDEPSITLNGNMFKKNVLYNWVINGETNDGKYFEYSGEFQVK